MFGKVVLEGVKVSSILSRGCQRLGGHLGHLGHLGPLGQRTRGMNIVPARTFARFPVIAAANTKEEEAAFSEKAEYREWRSPWMRCLAPRSQQRLGLGLRTGVCVLPHPLKIKTGGDDAHFVTAHSLGIADGVGGWAAHGVDPAVFARSLMLYCHKATTQEHDPYKILCTGHEAMRKTKIRGSSTACVFSTTSTPTKDDPAQAKQEEEEEQKEEEQQKDQDKEQEQENQQEMGFAVANLGDSGFMVVRGDEVLHRSIAQQSGFNVPFQLGPESHHTPQNADLYYGKLRAGDLVIMGTDGLFDNLYDHEIVEELRRNVESAEPTYLARLLAHAAQERAHTAGIVTPWYKAMEKLGIKGLPCGKPDDITVVVSVVDKQ